MECIELYDIECIEFNILVIVVKGIKLKVMERYINILDGKYYDCLLNKFVFSKKPLTQFIPNGLFRFSPIFSDEFIETNILRSRQQLILSVTEHCNFRCEYCIYCDQKYLLNYPLKSMSFSVAKKAIDDYLKNSQYSERRCISFYGGEPLLNFALIEQCVDYVESLSLSHGLDFLVTTNGVNLTKPISEYLYNHKFLVNISLDGPKSLHDRYRKLSTGEKTFETVVNNVNYLISLSPSYWKNALSFLCVLAPPIDIRSTIDFFELLPYKYTLSNVITTNHFENVIRNSFAYGLTNQNEEIYIKNRPRANQGILTEIRLIKQTMCNKKWYSSFSPGRYCIPGVKRTFVSADGNYYICEKDDLHEHRIIGNVDTGIDVKKVQKLRDEVLNFHKNNCSTCWAARFCGMCFATMDQFPKCCEKFRLDTKNAMKNILEEKYE